MKLDDIKRIVGTVAPTLAAALGGPLAGMATREIGRVLLGDGAVAEADVIAAVSAASPADLVKLKQLDLEFAARMEEAGVDIARIDAADRASARDRQVRTGDWTPSVLGAAIIIGFFGLLGWVLAWGLPTEGSEVLIVLIGALAAMVTQIGNYFFGSSAGSKEKQDIIARMQGQRR